MKIIIIIIFGTKDIERVHRAGVGKRSKFSHCCCCQDANPVFLGIIRLTSIKDVKLGWMRCNNRWFEFWVKRRGKIGNIKDFFGYESN